MDALEIAVELCKRFEGFRPRPYLCPAGVPTIGYGSTRYPDGSAVTLKDEPIGRERAEELLQADLRAGRLPAVLLLCPGANTPERIGALVDFAYNLGTGALKSSTLRKRVNAGDWSAVPRELRKWVRGGGRVLPGLVHRREAEAALV